MILQALTPMPKVETLHTGQRYSTPLKWTNMAGSPWMLGKTLAKDIQFWSYIQIFQNHNCWYALVHIKWGGPTCQQLSAIQRYDFTSWHHILANSIRVDEVIRLNTILFFSNSIFFFKKGMQSKSFSLGIEGGYEGAFASVKAGMKVSTSSKKTQAFFSSGEGMMLISEARCIIYMMSLNKVVPPKVIFENNFCLWHYLLQNNSF